MCPSGTGYNYFLACDTAERIIFAVVAGSGSGKLCWHSRGTDNDQENAGYVRESAGGSEQVLRLRAQAGAFRAPARVTFFFCKKKVTKENHLDLRSKGPLARGGFRRRGGEQVLCLRAQAGAFRAPARVPFFFCKKKGTKENHLDLRSKGPLARYGSCRFGGVYSRAGCSGHHCRSKGLCLRSPARRLPRPLAPATVGVFASTGLAIIKSRLCRLAAAKVGVPVGHEV